MPERAETSDARAAVRTRFGLGRPAEAGLGRITMAGRPSKVRDRADMTRQRMRTFPRYAVVYLYHGAGFYADAEGRDQRVAAGDLILVLPDLPHAYGPERGDVWQEFYLAFEGPVFDLWRQAGLLDARRPVRHLTPIDHWLRQFEGVLGGGGPAATGSPLLEVTRLQQVLAEALLSPGAGEARHEDRQWAEHACALLEARADHQLDLRAVADALGLSLERFRKRFTRLVGQPPRRYHTARLIDRACQLMQASDMSDKQIAHELGFCDEFYFSRRFKQITGESPRAFRRSLPAAQAASADPGSAKAPADGPRR